ncbi:ribulose-phosphate 3-epimerase [bacterium]|jgi:ribulose-phosphate 3-epimerase|nr:ribulose-phosphate 3-epimerase [bacterium]MBT4649152.1 ribulose-phosphate 3-epimerase [bacterium]
MPKKIQIIPAILAFDLEQLKSQYKKVAKDFDLLQIDIMDGEFVSSKNNLSPRKIKKIVKQQPLEIHLMVQDINSYIGQWSTFKNVKRIIWHYEALPDEEAIIQAVRWLKKQNIKAGLAINPTTTLKKILPLIKKFDTILIMGVTPGKQNQTFNRKALSKIKKLRKKFPNLNIEIDGGVNDKNYSKITKAGANLIAIGGYLQQAEDIKQAIAKLK